MTFTIEFERERDGRLVADVVELPGVLAYVQISDEAIAKTQAVALRILADRLEHGESAAPVCAHLFRAAMSERSSANEILVKCSDQNLSVIARFGVTDFAAQRIVCQVLNPLCNLLIQVRLAAILTHTRGDVSDDQDSVVAFDRQDGSTLL
jgi:hypothetical protein